MQLRYSIERALRRWQLESTRVVPKPSTPRPIVWRGRDYFANHLLCSEVLHELRALNFFLHAAHAYTFQGPPVTTGVGGPGQGYNYDVIESTAHAQ